MNDLPLLLFETYYTLYLRFGGVALAFAAAAAAVLLLF
jgi:hypothetical protein